MRSVVLVAIGQLCGVLAMVCGPSVSQAQCNQAGPDAIVGNIPDIGNYAPSGGYDAFALGITICNIGSANVLYSGCPNPHPVIGGNVYRYMTVNGAGRFEQIGQGWLKHVAVAAAGSLCCACQSGGTGLRVGCSDTYGWGFQGSQGTLGPRYLINAYTGDFPAACPPHPSGGNFGRIEVALSDVVPTPGGTTAAVRLFGEEHLVARDDATFTDAGHPVPSNGLNNASNIEMTASGTATDFTFGLLAPTQRMIPAIRRWQQIDPAVTESVVTVPGEGTYYLCSRATSLGGSPAMWHYEYAVFNLNSDRCGGSFSVPLDDAATVANLGFHSVLYRGGDGNGNVNFDGSPWSAGRSGGVLSWMTQPYATNINANALRWSTLYNFRFDADVPPAASNGTVTLGLWKPGSPGSMTAPAQTPTLGCIPVTVTADPMSAGVCMPGSASFGVSATGTEPLVYRWQIETSAGVWATLGNDPMPLPCGGGAFAYASNPFSSQSPIGVHACQGVVQYHVRALVANACSSVPSAPAILTLIAATAGDSNSDGIVDAADIAAFISYLGSSGPPSDGFCAADIDKSGTVDAGDIPSFVAALLGG